MVRLLDKTDWPDGPWQQEEDAYFWDDEATGYPCAIIRHVQGLGHLCGYVGIPETHPLYRRDHDDDAVTVQVHGGLTYAEGDLRGFEKLAYAEMHGQHLWWFGFDCAHLGDLSPGMLSFASCVALFEGDTYRDVNYVRAETLSLAAQLATLAREMA